MIKSFINSFSRFSFLIYLFLALVLLFLHAGYLSNTMASEAKQAQKVEEDRPKTKAEAVAIIFKNQP